MAKSVTFSNLDYHTAKAMIETLNTDGRKINRIETEGIENDPELFSITYQDNEGIECVFQIRSTQDFKLFLQQLVWELNFRYAGRNGKFVWVCPKRYSIPVK